ncbi:trehalose phosphatase [Malassezia pachydermatis]
MDESPAGEPSGETGVDSVTNLFSHPHFSLNDEEVDVKLRELYRRTETIEGHRPWMVDDAPGTTQKKRAPSGTAYHTSTPSRTARPPWILSLHRGHAALNSGVYSLTQVCEQTYIGVPPHITFAQQSKNDTRTFIDETTPEERIEIEQVLSSLQDRSTWTQHKSGLAMRPSALEAKETKKRLGIKYVPVWLDHKLAFAHYDAYCKTTLWPLFHYLMWRDDEDRSTWDMYSWGAYVRVNQMYADRAVAEHKTGDIVWVHDYHLLLVPLMIRRALPEAHIGLFVHTAFPSSELFRCLPQRRDILDGMLGADLICFQNQPYASHFLSCCVRILGLEVQGGFVESLSGRVTQVSHNTVGIDVARIEYDALRPGVGPRIDQLRNLYQDKRIIIACDKLDVVRGVVQKLQAFYELLLNYPQWRGRVVLIQITLPTINSSPKLERQVSELVSKINGHFGSLSFTPVQHYHQVIERDEYFALLSVADMALVTSVRDGMNTMSMEFVACQNQYSKSPLVLSEFTGTAGHLQGSVLINPWDIGGVAAAIHHALCMDEKEKVERHDRCYDQVVTQTSQIWALGLIQRMLLRLRNRHSAHKTPILDMSTLIHHYRHAQKRLIFLDYDGTLTSIVKDPEAALPSQRLLEALNFLTSDPRNIVYIISGRDQRFLSKHFGSMHAIGLSAEHGSFFKEHGEEHHWHDLSVELDMSWKEDVLNVFRYFTDRTIGSNIEQKKTSIVWHYRNADPDYGSFQAKECQALLDNILIQNEMQVEVVIGKKNVEVRPKAINKGETVHRILYANPDTEFVFCAGDDKTDEDMFRFLTGLRYVVHEQADGTMEPTGAEEVTVSPPTPFNPDAVQELEQKNLHLRREQIFATTVGSNSKRTRANWHVPDVKDIIDALAAMAEADGGTISS